MSGNDSYKVKVLKDLDSEALIPQHIIIPNGSTNYINISEIVLGIVEKNLGDFIINSNIDEKEIKKSLKYEVPGLSKLIKYHLYNMAPDFFQKYETDYKEWILEASKKRHAFFALYSEQDNLKYNDIRYSVSEALVSYSFTSQSDGDEIFRNATITEHIPAIIYNKKGKAEAYVYKGSKLFIPESNRKFLSNKWPLFLTNTGDLGVINTQLNKIQVHFKNKASLKVILDSGNLIKNLKETFRDLSINASPELTNSIVDIVLDVKVYHSKLFFYFADKPVLENFDVLKTQYYNYKSKQSSKSKPLSLRIVLKSKSYPSITVTLKTYSRTDNGLVINLEGVKNEFIIKQLFNQVMPLLPLKDGENLNLFKDTEAGLSTIDEHLSSVSELGLKADSRDCQKARVPRLINDKEEVLHTGKNLNKVKEDIFLCPVEYPYIGLTNKNTLCCFKKPQTRNTNVLHYTKKNQDLMGYSSDKEILKANILLKTKVSYYPRLVSNDNVVLLGLPFGKYSIIHALNIATNKMKLPLSIDNIVKFIDMKIFDYINFNQAFTINSYIKHLEEDQLILDEDILLFSAYFKCNVEVLSRDLVNRQVRYERRVILLEPVDKVFMMLVKIEKKTIVKIFTDTKPINPEVNIFNIPSNIVVRSQIINSNGHVEFANTDHGLLPLIRSQPSYALKQVKTYGLLDAAKQLELLSRTGIKYLNKPDYQTLNSKGKTVTLSYNSMIVPVLPSTPIKGLKHTFRYYYPESEIPDSQGPFDVIIKDIQDYALFKQLLKKSPVSLDDLRTRKYKEILNKLNLRASNTLESYIENIKIELKNTGTISIDTRFIMDKNVKLYKGKREIEELITFTK